MLRAFTSPASPAPHPPGKSPVAAPSQGPQKHQLHQQQQQRLQQQRQQQQQQQRRRPRQFLKNGPSDDSQSVSSDGSSSHSNNSTDDRSIPHVRTDVSNVRSIQPNNTNQSHSEVITEFTCLRNAIQMANLEAIKAEELYRGESSLLAKANHQLMKFSRLLQEQDAELANTEEALNRERQEREAAEKQFVRLKKMMAAKDVEVNEVAQKKQTEQGLRKGAEREMAMLRRQLQAKDTQLSSVERKFQNECKQREKLEVQMIQLAKEAGQKSAEEQYQILMRIRNSDKNHMPEQQLLVLEELGTNNNENSPALANVASPASKQHDLHTAELMQHVSELKEKVKAAKEETEEAKRELDNEQQRRMEAEKQVVAMREKEVAKQFDKRSQARAHAEDCLNTERLKLKLTDLTEQYDQFKEDAQQSLQQARDRINEEKHVRESVELELKQQKQSFNVQLELMKKEYEQELEDLDEELEATKAEMQLLRNKDDADSQELDDLRNQCKLFQEQIGEAQAQIKNEQSLRVELQAEMKLMEDELDNMEAALNKAQEEWKRTQQQLEEVRSDATANDSKLRVELREKVHLLEDENTTLEARVRLFREKYHNEHDMLETSEEKVYTLERSIKELTSKLEDLENAKHDQLEKSKQEVSKLKEQVSDLNMEIRGLQEDNDLLEKSKKQVSEQLLENSKEKISKLEQQVSKMTKENEKLQKDGDLLENSREQVFGLEQQVQDLTKEVKRLQNESELLETSEEQCNIAVEQVARLEEQVKEITAEFEKLQKECKKLEHSEERCKKAEEQVFALEQKVKELTFELETTAHQQQVSDERCETLRQRIQAVTANFHKTLAQGDNAEHTKVLQLQISTLRTELETSKEDNAALRGTLEKSQHLYRDLQRKQTNSSEVNKEAFERESALREQAEEKCRGLRQEIIQLKQEHVRALQDFQAKAILQENVDKLNDRIAGLEDELKSAETREKLLKDQHEAEQRMREEMEEQHEALMATLANGQQKEDSADKRSIMKLKEALLELKYKYDQALTELELAQEQVQKIQLSKRALLELQIKYDKCQKELKKAYENQKTTLKSTKSAEAEQRLRDKAAKHKTIKMKWENKESVTNAHLLADHLFSSTSGSTESRDSKVPQDRQRRLSDVGDDNRSPPPLNHQLEYRSPGLKPPQILRPKQEHQFRDQILQSLPDYVKKSFGCIGFVKHSMYDHWPALVLDPFTVPLNIQQKWMELYYEFDKRDMFLVYLYGRQHRQGVNAYPIVDPKHFVAYQEGVERSLDQLPSEINLKLQYGDELTTIEEELHKGLTQIKEDANKPSDNRYHPLDERRTRTGTRIGTRFSDGGNMSMTSSTSYNSSLLGIESCDVSSPEEETETSN